MSKAVIRDVQETRLVSIKTDNFFRSKISESNYVAKVEYSVPFRVKFINIGVPGYSSSNVPPIGIAVIGLNNYIL